MQGTKTEKLRVELKKLEKAGDIEGSALVARNGLLIASNMPRDIDERRFAAMSATMMGAIETAAATVAKGALMRITAETEHAIIVTMGAGKNAILVITAASSANLGMVMVEMETAIENIRSIMED